MKLVWNQWTGFIVLFSSVYAAVLLSHSGYELLNPIFCAGLGYLLYRTMWSWLGLPAFLLAAYHMAVLMQMNIPGTVMGTWLVFIGLLLIIKRKPAAVAVMWGKMVAKGRLLSEQDDGLAAVLAVLKQEFLLKWKMLNPSQKFGDLHLDLSKVMIPEGERLVDISRWVGSVNIYVPYDLELAITCIARIGTVDLFGERKKYRGQIITSDYAEAERKVMLTVFTGIGDVSVRRL